MTRQEIVIIGAGGAGLAAAIEAAEAGAAVTLLDAAQTPGGTTAMSGGVIYAAGTATQKAAGIEDSVEELFSYYMAVTRHLLEPQLVRTAVEGARRSVEWLERLGVSFDPRRLYIAGLETTPRGHMAGGEPSDLGPGGGAVIASALLRAATSAGAVVRTGTRVTDLLLDDHRVVGLSTEDGERITADAVIVATGGFGHNRELLERFYPDATVNGDWHWYIGPPEIRGDGLTLGRRIGGAIVGHNRGVMMETPNFNRVVDPFTPPWLVFVNSDGHRFINEMASYCVMGAAIGAQPGGRCFALFDHAALSESIDRPAFVDPYGMGADFRTNWTQPVLRAQIEAGAVKQGESLTELAAAAGVDPAGLTHTVERWNADVEAGHDAQFEKPATMLLPIGTPPFYAVELRPAVIGMTFAGLRIDHHARVLNTAGEPIPGLYAAGETTGGLMGPMYPGGGASVGNAITFGRIAGRSSARSAW